MIVSHKKRIVSTIYFILFLTIVLGFIAYAKYVGAFNASERKEKASFDKNSIFSIYPRNDGADTWVKNISVENQDVRYRGIIYEAAIRNSSEYTITEWNMQINIHNSCYIKDAWCGTFEIHQFVDGNENIQTLDFKNYVYDDIELDYMIVDQELLIPLNEGDYLIYHPNEQVNETPVTSLLVSESDVHIGITFYFRENETANLSDVTFSYFMKKDLWQGAAFKLLISLLFLWCVAVIITIAVNISVTMSRKRLEQKDEIIFQSIRVFTRYFDAKDDFFRDHSQRVAGYAQLIAQKLGYSAEEVQNVYYIALMHDCGKCYIPESILNKPGRLTENEYQIIKNHTLQGAEMLKDFTAIEGIADGAMYHHERYDGGGYPTGKKGEEIPMIGRIICLADAFDAMNSKRCFRNELSKENIMNEILQNRGKQFDPVVVDCLIKLIEEGKIQFGTK